MKSFFPLLLFCLIAAAAPAQVAQKIKTAMAVFNADEQLSYAISSLYIIDAASGDVVFDQNSRIGLAPASTEKIITAATAFDMLGTAYTYDTRFGILTTTTGKSLYIRAGGDPALGSWRWDATKEQAFMKRLKQALANKGITALQSVIIDASEWEDEAIPDGWIWQDVGNYYGAGAQPLNWRENQFDLVLKSGSKIGDAVSVVKTNPYLYDYNIISKATAASKGSGDNSNLYLPSSLENGGVLTGTIPAAQNAYVVAGAICHPTNQFAKTIIDYLKGSVAFAGKEWRMVKKPLSGVDWFYTNSSPTMAALAYWFLRKSINLYGEAFIKALSLETNGNASTNAGIDLLKNHWKTRGIHPDELHLYDGSGLSPQNRTTTHAQVTVLRYAKDQPWYKEYYDGFPLYNEMKMKSGTISRVKGFAGYQKSSSGKEYIFSFLVNNYNGSAYTLVRKMYKVLDELK